MGELSRLEVRVVGAVDHVSSYEIIGSTPYYRISKLLLMVLFFFI